MYVPYVKLTELDRNLFALLAHTTERAPASLGDISSVIIGYSREEVSASLARLLSRGMVVELSGRRFFARLTVSEPLCFTPLAGDEWVSISGAR